jgi:hypothetical protein
MSLSLGLLIGLQCFAQQAPSLSKKIASSAELSQMTLPELRQGLLELNQNLNSLSEDLDKAEAKHDGRLAIKIRNGIALSTAGYLIFRFLKKSTMDLPGRMANIYLTVILGTVGAASVLGTQGYIYLTSSEIHSLKAKITETKKTIKLLVEQIEKKETTRK